MVWPCKHNASGTTTQTSIILAKANEKRPVGQPRRKLTSYNEDLEWNRLGLKPSEIMDVMKDPEVWPLNLEQLPLQLLRINGQ